MEVGKRVRHKSGLTGRIIRITEWVYVWIDGTRTVIPYSAGSLEVIEERDDMDKSNELEFASINNSQTSVITLSAAGEEILRLEQNGDFIYKGRLIENDKEIVDAFRLFLQKQGLM